MAALLTIERDRAARIAIQTITGRGTETANGIRPGYEQKAFSRADLDGRLRLVASPDGRDGSVTIHTDASFHAGQFDKGMTGELVLPKGRHAWVQVARGQARLNGHDLQAGDGAALSDVPAIRVEGIGASEVLVFDLA